MNKHDQSRKDALVRTLCKAKDQAETARLYLTANNRDPEDIATVNLVLEHIEIALDHLGTKESDDPEMMTCPCGCGMTPCLESQ